MTCHFIINANYYAWMCHMITLTLDCSHTCKKHKLSES
jgi:hypothetical protein